MTPDEERRLLKMLEANDRLLKMLEDHEWAVSFWLKTGIWAKWLATAAAGVAGTKYLWDFLKGAFK